MKPLSELPSYEKDSRPFQEQLLEAKKFFSSIEGGERSSDNPYADKDGLIQFIIASELYSDPQVFAKVQELKKYLVSITSVVTDYVNRYAAEKGEEWKTDVRLWELAISKIPLMGPSRNDSQTYSRNNAGVSISKDFVSFILDVVVSEGTAALDSFSRFLEKQGEALRMGVESNQDAYKTLALGVSIEVFGDGQSLIYVPKIQRYRIDFSRENSKFSSFCASAEKVSVHFEYEHGVGVFDYEALEDPDVKAEFDLFIQEARKAQIKEASTFFEDDFPTFDDAA